MNMQARLFTRLTDVAALPVGSTAIMLWDMRGKRFEVLRVVEPDEQGRNLESLGSAGTEGEATAIQLRAWKTCFASEVDGADS